MLKILRPEECQDTDTCWQHPCVWKGYAETKCALLRGKGVQIRALS